MKGLAFIIILMTITQCTKENETFSCENSVCNTEATVINLTGLDGCGLMFELADGTRLEPERRTYIQAPSVEDDPLYHFELIEGQQVKISWDKSTLLSTCMAGKMVYITCITECKKP